MEEYHIMPQDFREGKIARFLLGMISYKVGVMYDTPKPRLANNTVRRLLVSEYLTALTTNLDDNP